MGVRQFIAHHERNPVVRTGLFVLGVLTVIVSPIVGAIPGPGGVFVFAIGFGMMLRYSHWTKRVYARAKRRWPKQGHWVDWGLRRGSALRRAERSKQARRGN
jgi:hypothetical protein